MSTKCDYYVCMKGTKKGLETMNDNTSPSAFSRGFLASVDAEIAANAKKAEREVGLHRLGREKGHAEVEAEDQNARLRALLAQYK